MLMPAQLQLPCPPFARLFINIFNFILQHSCSKLNIFNTQYYNNTKKKLFVLFSLVLQQSLLYTRK